LRFEPWMQCSNSRELFRASKFRLETNQKPVKECRLSQRILRATSKPRALMEQLHKFGLNSASNRNWIFYVPVFFDVPHCPTLVEINSRAVLLTARSFSNWRPLPFAGQCASLLIIIISPLRLNRRPPQALKICPTD
jgi:hypothetical protein